MKFRRLMSRVGLIVGLVLALCTAAATASATILPGPWSTGNDHRIGLYNCYTQGSSFIVIHCWFDDTQVCWANLGGDGLFLNDGLGLSTSPGTPQTDDTAYYEGGGTIG